MEQQTVKPKAKLQRRRPPKMNRERTVHKPRFADSTDKSKNAGAKAKNTSSGASVKRQKQKRAPRPVQNEGKRSGKSVKIIFLGGVGEIGKNMTALECGDDIPI